MTKQRTKPNTALWVVLALALALRLVLALVTEGYPYDMSCFVAWGDKLAAQGPAAFYSEGYFADYPPGYLWVLGLVGVVRAALGIAYESRWTHLLLALVPSVCDCVSAALVYAVARRGTVGRYQCCWWRCYADWSAAFKRVWETRAGFCLWRVGWPSPL